MNPAILGPLILGGTSLLGGMLNNQANASAVSASNERALDIARENNQWGRENMHEQMAYNERMANSAYQRMSEDMKAAGINPMVGYGGGGAATPGINNPSASMPNIQTPKFEDALSKGVSSALEGRRLRKELDQTDSGIALNKAMEETQGAQKKLNEANAKSAELNAKALEKQLPTLEKQAEYEKEKLQIDQKMLKYDSLMNRVKQGTGVINDATSILRPKIQLGPRLKKNEMIIDNNTGEILNKP